MSKKKNFFKSNVENIDFQSNLIEFWKFQNTINGEIIPANLVLGGGATYADGLVGRCLDLTSSTLANASYNDTSQYFAFGNGTTDIAFSVSFLVNFNALANIVYFIDRRSGTVAGRMYWMQFNNTNGRVALVLVDESTDGNIAASVDMGPSTSTWYHICFTYDGSSSETGINGYINGVSSGQSQSLSGSYTAMEKVSTNIYFGKYRQDGTLSLDGYMDEIAFWDVELTPTQVAQLAAVQLAGIDILP